MIYLQFTLNNPWKHRWEILKCKHGLLYSTKAWEITTYRTNQIISFEFRYTIHSSHAGLTVMLGLLGFTIEASILDVRHWIYDKNDWENI